MSLFQQRRQQQGVVLIVGLMVLLMVTLMAVSGFNLSQSNLKVVGNMESREQAMNAANAAIEEAVSATLFVSSPTNVFTVNCTGSNTRCYDTNGDGANDITVQLDPARCVTVDPISKSELEEMMAANPTNTKLPTCIIAEAEGTFGGTESGRTLCAHSLWELRAEATDNVTQATAAVTQGVSLMVSLNDTASCPE